MMLTIGDRVFTAIFGFAKVLEVYPNGTCKIKLEKLYPGNQAIVEVQKPTCVKIS